jgi:hypothetical protein
MKMNREGVLGMHLLILKEILNGRWTRLQAGELTGQIRPFFLDR